MEKGLFLRQFSKQALDNRISLFLGAGGTSEAGYPTWSELYSCFANDLGLKIEECNNYYHLAQYYSNKFGYPELKKRISNDINKDSYESHLVEELIKVGFVNIWTTNFDNVLEKNYEQYGIPTNKIFEDTHLSNIDLYKKVNIFKMNGDIQNIDKIIATQNDYESYQNTHGLMLTFFKRELISNTFLFIGYSFLDNLVLECLSEIRNYLGNSANHHYAIMKNKPENSYFKYFIDDLNARYNIKILLVDEYSEILEVIKELNERIRRKKVFVSGAFSSFDENVETFSHNIAKCIADSLLANDYRIVNGIGRHFGTHLIGYANEYLAKNGVKNIEKHLVIRPFVGNEHNSAITKKLLRERVLSQCGASIFIFGENDYNALKASSGVTEEFEISIAQGKTIIPISFPGMISEQLWRKVKDNITQYPYLEKEIDELTSGNEPQYIAKLIVKILNSIQDV